MIDMLDHATLRTSDVEGTREFLQALLGLKPGFRPPFSFPGYWLYAGNRPIIHLIPGEAGRPAHGKEGIDHIGFRLTDYDETLARLAALNAPCSRMELPELGERRLFVRTPTGILIELVFRDDGIASSNRKKVDHA